MAVKEAAKTAETYQPGQKFMLRTTNLMLLVFVTACLFGCPIAIAGVGGVRDNGDFFSEPAKKEATRKISELEKQFKKDLVVETFTVIPDEIKQGIDMADKSATGRMFEQWTIKEAKQQKVNGIYVLISREPAHLQIVVGNDTQKHAFTLQDRDRLAGLMLGKLRAKQNDEALSECVKFVSNTMSSHANAGTHANGVASSPSAIASRNTTSDPSFSWGWILAIVLGIGAIWVVVGVLRSFMGRSGMPAGPGMMPSGGGGMFSSLLGGMFGAAAGMYLYDQFTGNHGNAWGNDQESRNMGSDGFSGQDTDYSGTGGDFGGGDFGGDSGGDTSGGGDF